MTRRIKPTAVVMCLIVTSLSQACSSEAVVNIERDFAKVKVQSKTVASTSLALSSFAAQLALYHVTAAVCEEFSKGLNDGKVVGPPALASEGTRPTYVIDLNSGTGQIELNRDGRKAVDLRLAFEQSNIDRGRSVRVTSMSGQVEGFQIFFSELNIRTFGMPDDKGNLMETSSGDKKVQIYVNGRGFLGLANQPVSEITSASLSLQVPLEGEDQAIGAISVKQDRLVLESQVLLANQRLIGKGVVKDTEGNVAFNVNTMNRGDVKLEVAQSPTPAAEPSAAI